MKNTLEKVNTQRTTAQRALLLELIRQAEGHLDAVELYQQAREKQPGLSLSTVYRNLRLFKDQGLVEEHQLDGTRHCYETKPGSRHCHLICIGCGRIIEFKCSATERLKTRINREAGFEVTETKVRLNGYCPECRQRLNSGKADTDVTPNS